MGFLGFFAAWPPSEEVGLGECQRSFSSGMCPGKLAGMGTGQLWKLAFSRYRLHRKVHYGNFGQLTVAKAVKLTDLRIYREIGVLLIDDLGFLRSSLIVMAVCLVLLVRPK